MSIYLAISDRDTQPFKKYLQKFLPENVRIFEYQEKHNPEEIEMVVAWKHIYGSLKPYQNAKLISSMGAGVDHMLNDPDLPRSPKLSRVVDPQLTLGMQHYVVWSVLHLLKNIPVYDHLKSQHLWKPVAENTLYQKIGILGMGVLGSACGFALKNLGFVVKGYSKHPKNLEGIEVFDYSSISLVEFVADCGIIICLLPSTPENRDILNEDLFSNLPKGACVVNPGRGSHLNEADLIKAIEVGFLQHAILDVFKEEPLPENNPLWSHPSITITPHVASVSNPESTSKILAESYLKIKEGLSPHFEVYREKGY
jgi:glyoxylate/hydroxypyruvate reductase